jgi:hypothetical protein
MKNSYLLGLLLFNPCFIYAKDLSTYKNMINQFSSAITGSTIWNLDSNGISGVFANHIDRLGEAVSHGDYNNDGIQDLAIGIPNYDSFFSGTNFTNSGTVLILYGSPSGLSSANHAFLYQTLETDPPLLENLNGVEANDFFGKSLASGDFNCDGITDLAVGSPEESVTINGEFRSAVGAVNVFHGSDNGFTFLGQGSTFLVQSTGVSNVSANNRFGWSMVAENFNGNGCDDLAVSAPFHDFGGVDLQIVDAGLVKIFYGRTQGLSGFPQFSGSVSQTTDDNPNTVIENGDLFGYSLAAGRLSLFGNGADLVVGIPGENINNETNAGAIQVFFGSAAGIDAGDPNETWSQAGAIIGVVEANDRFGYSVTVGNFNGDFLDDVAVGVPREDLNNSGINDAGVVNIIYSGAFGLETDGNQAFHQNTANLLGTAENSDRFGDVLAVGDLNDDNFDDLVIGVPREDDSKGAFHILYGSANGISTDGNQYETNIFFGGAVLDEMGYAITVANFGNGKEIAVGIPGDDSDDGDNDSGSVEVFSFRQPDLMFSNSFEE